MREVRQLLRAKCGSHSTLNNGPVAACNLNRRGLPIKPSFAAAGGVLNFTVWLRGPYLLTHIVADSGRAVECWILAR
jgi:hypothetical protein